uniref:Activin_recp domain-containing protein n=1 Tax=Heterorhabditis bacteriophora TaxID=37862 RepID=A0A1I7XP71_HETBA
MRLGIFLVLLSSSLALKCNVGNLVVENGQVILRNIEVKSCNSACIRNVLTTKNENSGVIMLSCSENTPSEIYENSDTCSDDNLLAYKCQCKTSLCNDVKLPESTLPIPQRETDE